MPTKQIPALPPLDEAPADDDRFALRDTSSGSDKSLRVDRFLERSGEQVSDHATETGGIHGIPEGERAVHTADLGPAPDNVPTNQQLVDGVEREVELTATHWRLIPAASGAADGFAILLEELGAGDNARTSGVLLALRDGSTAETDRTAYLSARVDTHSPFESSHSGTVHGEHALEDWADPHLAVVSHNGVDRVAVVVERVSGTGAEGVNSFFFNGVSSSVDDIEVIPVDEDTTISPFEPTRDPRFFGRPGDSIQGQSLYIAGDIGDTVEVMIDGDGNVVEA